MKESIAAIPVTAAGAGFPILTKNFVIYRKKFTGISMRKVKFR